MEVQAQNDELQLNALKDAVLTSSAGKITIAAKEEILITCKGAYIKLANGEVEIGSPKLVRVKAPMEVTGPNSYTSMRLPLFEVSKRYALRFQMLDDDQNPYAHTEYAAYLKDAQIHKGKTDENGYTEVFYSLEPERIKIQMLYSNNLNIDDTN